MEKKVLKSLQNENSFSEAHIYVSCRLDTTINEMDFSSMKTSRRLDRSNHSLLSADNSIPEESEEEEEEENEEVGDSEEKRGCLRGG